MVVVVASYYRLGLINIALRYTCFLNTLKYICMQRGVLSRAFFQFLLYLSISSLFLQLPLSIFVSLRFRSYSRSFPSPSLRYLRIRAINSLITFFSSQPRFYSFGFRSSCALLLFRFCYARLILLLPLCPVFLSCAGISRCNASPARSCNPEKENTFLRYPASRATNI